MESHLVATMLLLILGTGSVACTQPPPPSTARTDQVLEAWLTCEECSDGELQALVALGQPIVSRLGDALRTGPSQERLNAVRTRLAATYQSMVEYARTHPDAPVPMAEREYIDRHLENFIVMYQGRAATGLGAIGGPAAKAALTQASLLPLRAPVLALVREALQRLQ